MIILKIPTISLQNYKIFGYEISEKIRLISIPDEIIFYNVNDVNTKLSNGDILNKEYILKQNESLVKTNKYYYLEFQFIVQEPDYNTFNSKAKYIIDYPSSSSDEYVDQSTYYEYKTFYGKKISIKFKLCHEFCSTCKKIGTSINDQKCETCLEDYQYFYEGDFSNCVQEGYFIDKEENILVECTSSNSKYYTDLETNKRICFKITYSCPETYPFLNISTNECQNYIIPVTNPSFNCNYNKLLDNKFSFSNYNNSEIYIKLISEVIQTYPNDGVSLVIDAQEKYVFQLTNGRNEMNSLKGNNYNKYNLSIIDLGECEILLREKNYIDINTSLIILKYEKITNIASEKKVQYEIYNLNEKTKLDLSICQNTSINLYIPITLTEETQNLYKDLKEYGYDLFNINDSFYQDICTPYKSENNTDVLLSDRRKDYYTNETICQNNCEYSGYIPESQLIRCVCNIENEEIDTINMEKFNGKMIYQSFYDVLKYSNFKVLKCYKLVFNINVITKNKGSLIVISYFIIYISFLIIYIRKGIFPLEIDTAKTIFEKIKIEEVIKNNDFSNDEKPLEIKENKNEKIDDSIKNNNIKNININFPPRKRAMSTKICIVKNDNIDNNNTLIINNNSLNSNFRIKSKHRTKMDKSYNKLDNNSLSVIKNNNSINIKGKISGLSKKIVFRTNSNKEKDKLSNEQERLDDFELNELDYIEALELDKRPFCKIYWSILRREHIIIFTFFIWNDYNLTYIKLSRFIFLLCTDMAMNVIFFSDDSMHKIYLNYGKYDFIQHIPQIIYSIIVSQLLEVFLSYLSMTDKHHYQIKHLQNQKENKILIFQILNKIKVKLLIFFIFTFILFVFYWYFISSFCAVYENTQIIFIKDSFSSFLTSQLYPFILYFFPAILRLIALKDSEKKRLSIVYKISDIIPIF